MLRELTPARFLQTVCERWLTLFVCTAIGAGAGYGIALALPDIYEARGEFTMNVKVMGAKDRTGRYLEHDYGTGYNEVYNTRMYEWCSEAVLGEVLKNYRIQHPSDRFTDEQVADTLTGSRLELQPRSHLLTITVRGRDPRLVADLANEYVKEIESYSTRVGHRRATEAVAGMIKTVSEQKDKVARLNQDLAVYHKVGKVEELKTDIDTLEKQVADLAERLSETELEDRSLFEWVKVLREVKRHPENFGVLSAKAPRAAEINAEYTELQRRQQRYDALITAYTKRHPAVKLAAKELEDAKTRFRETTRRALATGAAMLKDNHRKLLEYRERHARAEKELGDLRQKMVSVKDGARRLVDDLDSANKLLEKLTLDMEHARSDAEILNDTIAVGLPAVPPEKPFFPDPRLFTGAGAGAGLIIGFVCILMAARRDDRIRGVMEIEELLGLEVIAVLPQEERGNRRELSRSPELDAGGRFAEAAAFLRNQLDSPRFDSVSRRVLVLSTQPGEGKTSTSTALAIAFAQISRRTLLVDFDLRRPQQARIWNLPLTPATSFSHMLQRSLEGGKPDFASVVNESTIPGLDVIASLPPEGVHPASIFGSRIIRDFFIWARARYDRIVIDAPPWGWVGDSVTLAMMADSVLLMCRPGSSSASQIASCVEQLTEAGARVLGAVVNRVPLVEARAFVPGRHHENKTDSDREELLEQTRSFADED